MPELPKKKVGIVSCSGEELPEGTVARLSALKVLEKMRPDDTVTICLPLFLAGGEGDRAFAKYYPTIALDGCEKRCAFRGTEMYSNKPAASIVVTDVVAEKGLSKPEGKRQLNPAGLDAVDVVAQKIVEQVDELLGKGWSRREGAFHESATEQDNTRIELQEQYEVVATCACGSGVPVQTLVINGEERILVALPVILQNVVDAGKAPCDATLSEIMEMVKIYNSIASTEAPEIQKAVGQAYKIYWQKYEVAHG